MTTMKLNNSNDIVANSVRLVSSSGGLVDVGNVLSYTPTLADLILKADKSTSYLKTEIDSFLSSKANQSTSYLKTEIDSFLNNKANQSTSYLKTEIDSFLTAKAAVGSSYTIAQSDANYLLKADKSNSYLKSEVDGFLNLKANTGVSYTIAQSDANYLLKADKSNSYLKSEVDGFLNLKANTGVSYTIAQSDANYLLKADKSTTYTMTAIDSLLTAKAPQSSTYTKTETDTLLTAKATQSSTYTKTETDTLLTAKATQSSTYTKTEMDSALATKASNGTSYTKAEDDALLLLKAPQSSTYTKTETDTLLTGKANNSAAYTKSACDTLLAAKQATLTSASTITVSTLSCTSLSATGLLTAITCSGDASIAGALTITGNASSARFTSGASARFYHDSTGLTSGVVSHQTALRLAISSTIPTLTGETYITLDTSGVTVSKALFTIDTTITGALTVSGNTIWNGTTNSFNGLVYGLRFTSGGTSRFYNNNYGSYTATVISHPTLIQLALSNTVPPLSTELAITIDSTSGIVLNKLTEAKAGLYITGGNLSITNDCYAYGDHYIAVGKTFYSPNFVNPSLYDRRLILGTSTSDALKMYAGPLGVQFYQHTDNGAASILTLQSTDKKAVFYGNITTQTGGSVSASSFPTLSDARVKTNIISADLSECERLVKTISPKGYERTDYNSGRKLGYVAQDWLQEISNDFNCVVSDYDEYDSNGETQRTLHAIDTLPIIATIHGALKVALNKIEQLEARVAMLEHVF